ncbi:hypothetical protein SLEP1_g21049 [Rubroshorea leprosula]|uniref:Uncharacterized protein n=1 Tax=Rubroshorea leprosula TaxID=152421 RepID=A0AAV5JAQ3_9ROSI|nr:hypothetical protein SLEP1_g21049 [Rubroshorea leprosula]
MVLSYLGVMVGVAPLIRSLPETYEDMYRFFTIEDDEGGVVDVVSGSPSMDSTSEGSEYLGIISPIVSRVRTTSAMEGLESVSSWQHFMAKFTNFSTHSEGYEPILTSRTENIVPD